MKKILFSIISFAISYLTFAQAPQSFQYQAVVRDNGGVAIPTQAVGFQLSIISGSPTGTVEYVEQHAETTNAYGVVTLSVGTGNVQSGTFSTISWGAATHFIKVEADLGSGLIDMGTTQLLSVPYALYSETAGNIQTYTAGSGINITGNVISNTAPDQIVNLTGTGATSVTGSYPNFTISSTDNVNDADADPANEIQILGIAGQTLSITGGNSVTLPTTTYNAGTGINVTGTTITNTAPDQTVTIAQGGATTVSGSYPNFTVSSTDANTTYSAGTGLNLTGTTFSSTQTLAQTLANGNTAGTYNILMNNNNVIGAHILGLGASNANYIDMYNGHIYDYNGSHGINGQVLTVHGISPNTWVTWDSPTSYIFGNGLSLTGNTVNSVWSTNGNHIYNNNAGNVGVGLNNPLGKMVVQGDTLTSDTIPLFEVKDKLGHTVFVVYPDSVHIYVKDTGAKSNKGGFAVSGKNMSKALTHDFLYVDPDFTRIYTGDSTAGFGVENIGGGSSTSYLHLTPSNYFIGHQAGDSITSGLYNSFIGYKSGKNNTSGLMNTFMGYQAGMQNDIGQANVFIGLNAGLNNTSGQINTFVGTESGYSNTTGSSNTFIGSGSGHANINGSYNTFMGMNSGMSNIAGGGNTFLGSLCGSSNTSGNNNLFVGNSTGFYNTVGNNNVFMGPYAGLSNIDGDYNVFIGSAAGYYNTSGYNNIFMGDASGMLNTTGSDNICIGRNTGSQLNGGWRNVFTGVFSGSNTTTGSYNSFYGAETGIQNTSGYNNSLFGYRTGNYITSANSNSFYGTECGLADTSGNYNCFFGCQSGYFNKNGNNNVYIGYFSGHSSTGSGNVFLGFGSGMNELGSNKLYVTNTVSDSNTSLIYGEFDNNVLKFNAKVNINNVINLAPRNSPPLSPVEGDMYMDSVSHKLFVFDGSIWQACW